MIVERARVYEVALPLKEPFTISGGSLAVRRSLIVELERWDPDKEYERLGLTQEFVNLFECKVPKLVMPVEPGRNIAELIEIAALMQRLRSQGVNVAEDFDERIRGVIRTKGPSRRLP